MFSLLDLYLGGSVSVIQEHRDCNDDGGDYETDVQSWCDSFESVTSYLWDHLEELRDDPDFAAHAHELDRLMDSLPANPPTWFPDGGFTMELRWGGLLWQGVAAGRYWFLLHHPVPPPISDHATLAAVERQVNEALHADRGKRTVTLSEVCERAGLPAPAGTPTSLRDAGEVTSA